MSLLDTLGDIAGAIPIIGGAINSIVDIFSDARGGGGGGSISYPAPQAAIVQPAAPSVPVWIWFAIGAFGLFLILRK